MRTISKQSPQTNQKRLVCHLLLISIIFWLPILLLSIVVRGYIPQGIFSFDTIILRWIHTFSTSALDIVFLFFTSIGNASFVIPVAICIAVYLLCKRRHVQLLLFAFGVGGAALANLALKLIFQRERPALWHTIITETDYSFPSGHAMVSSAFILCLIIILWYTRWRTVTIVIGTTLIVMIGLSRLYLGVHYPSDILAGWAASTGWILAIICTLRIVTHVGNRVPARSKDDRDD